MKIIHNGAGIIKNNYPNNSINIINLFKNLKQLFLRRNKNILKLLENVNLKELKELNLQSNKISDIKVLEKVEFDKLEMLNLYYNEISDITCLENANFKCLKQLNLYHN